MSYGWGCRRAGREPRLPFISAGYILCQHAVEEVDMPPRQIHLHLFIEYHYRDSDSCFGNSLLFFSITPSLQRQATLGTLDRCEVLQFGSNGKDGISTCKSRVNCSFPRVGMPTGGLKTFHSPCMSKNVNVANFLSPCKKMENLPPPCPAAR